MIWSIDHKAIRSKLRVPFSRRHLADIKAKLPNFGQFPILVSSVFGCPSAEPKLTFSVPEVLI